jgi:hypothetical protein
VAALAALGVVCVLIWPETKIFDAVFQVGVCLYCVLHRQLFAGDPAVLTGP